MFYFGVHLAELILKHTDSLSKSLQSTSMSAIEGAQHYDSQNAAGYSHYDAFWDLVLKAKQDIDVDDPKLPRFLGN